MDARSEPVGPRARLRRFVARLGQQSVAPPRPIPPRMPRPAEPEPEPAMRRAAGEFLALVDGLVRRPRRTDRGLPLVWLTGNKNSGRVLDAIEERVTAPS